MQSAGTVVVASAVVSAARAQAPQSDEAGPPPEGLQERADRLAESRNVPAEGTATEANAFLNGAFRNTPLGSFRNTPVGGFRNTPLGNFRNGGWPNGGWGGFNNGGWPNFGWRNW